MEVNKQDPEKVLFLHFLYPFDVCAYRHLNKNYNIIVATEFGIFIHTSINTLHSNFTGYELTQ